MQNEPPQADPPKRKRRWFQFSLMAMLGVIGSIVGGVRIYSAELSEPDVKEIRRIVNSIEDGSLPQPPGWTFNHAASEQGEKELEEVGYADSAESLELVALKAGGWAKYKARVASLLNSNDPVVRGFAAIWLADLGDRTYAKQLLALLQTEHTPGKHIFRDWDRSCAAQAVGVIGDRDDANELVKFLKHESPPIRTGAAMGLAWMRANDRHKEIAALIDDDEEDVRCAAIGALAMLGEKQYASRFAKIATKEDAGLFELPSALSALVRMQAEEQAPEIAKLLDDKDHPLARGQAIMTLALLNRKEYAKDFAALLGNHDVREDAMQALGILKETQYADKIAPFLHAENRSDRQAAAWSLIMMESKPHATAVLAVYDAFEQQQSGIPSDVLGDASRSLEKRFKVSLSRLTKGL